MNQQLVADAKALILDRGTIRSGAIAELLGCAPAAVHRLLQPAVDSGELIACAVEAGGEKLVEYRYSAAGSGMVRPAFSPYRSAPEMKKPPTPVRGVFYKKETVFGADPAPGGAMSPLLTRAAFIPPKEPKVNNTTKIVKALKKRGPLTVPELRKYMDIKRLAIIVAQLRAHGTLKRLGGGAHSSIYGLPGQVLEDRDKALGAAPKVRQVQPPKKAAGGAKAPRKYKKRKARNSSPAVEDRQPVLRAARIVAGRFRPAIACDGALLLTGAVEAFELNSAETRVLADFLARVDRTGVRA